MEAKRLDLGADVVVLPQRDLIVIHPSLSYGEALGAVMGTLPDLHPDVAASLVEQVTPRPTKEPRRWSLIAFRATVLAMLGTVGWGIFGGHPAQADPAFGPNWHAAIDSLGIDCNGGKHDDRRTCVNTAGDVFTMTGYRHETATMYVSRGPLGKVIFVFDRQADADRYATLHPDAEQRGRAIIW